MLSEEDVRTFLGGSRVIHMYGALKEKISTTISEYSSLEADFTDYGSTVTMATANALIDKWNGAAEDLQVIDPHTKNIGDASAQASKLFSTAEKIYFLGFAFDSENVKRLGFPLPDLRGNNRHFSFTNLQNSGTVNKHVADALRMPSFRMNSNDFYNGTNSAEKSVRNTYDAIALDFGQLSEIP